MSAASNPLPTGFPPTMTHTQKKQKTDSATPVQLQRRRVWRACEGCRRKKIKCDGRTPVCSQCSLTSATCTWLETKDRAALSRHYVQELEARVLHMESLLEQVAPAIHRLGATDAAAQGPPKAPTAPPSTTQPTPAASTTSPDPDRSDDGLDESVTDQFGQLALDSNGHLRWIGSSSSIALIEAFRNMSDSPAAYEPTYPPEQDRAVNRLFFAPSTKFHTRIKALPGPEEVEYPPRDLADKLVKAYFASFHHTLPVIDSPTFIERYHQHMADTYHRIPTRADTGFLSLIFAVFACGAQFVDDERLRTDTNGTDLDDGMAMVYYERALVLFYIGSSHTQLAHVQALLLLSSYLATANHLPQSWLLCGQAVRIAQDLGLHRSPRHLMLTPIDKETRRKVWWGVYGLDRMLAVSLGRPIGIEDADCDVEFPIEVDDVDLPQHLAYRRGSVSTPSSTPGSTGSAPPGTPPPLTSSPPLIKGFIALTILYKIAGKVLRSVYALDKCKENLEEPKVTELQKMVDQLDAELTAWCENLPSVFKNDPKTPQQVSLGAILCTSYYAVLITLHRNSLPTRRNQAPTSASSSVTKSICASRSCIFFAQSMKDAIPPSHHLAFFVQYLFSSAIIILLCVMHTTDIAAANTAMGEVETCMNCLAALESAWPGAKKCKEVLSELIQVTRAGLTMRISGKVPSLSQPIKGGVPIPASSQQGQTQGQAPRTRRKSRAMHSPSNSRSEIDFRASGSPLSKSDDPATSQQASPTSGFNVRGGGSFTQPSPTPSSRPAPKKRGHDAIAKSEPSDMEFAFHNTFSSTYTEPPSSMQNYASASTSPQPSHLAPTSPADNNSPFNTFDPAHSLSPEIFNFNGLQSQQMYEGSTSSQQWPFQGGSDPSSSSVPPTGVRFNPVSPLMSYNVPPNGNGADPSAAQFDLSGLPFSGMDFLQGFTPALTPNIDSGADTFWNSYGGGAGAFKFGPDLPFNLSDNLGDG